MAKLKQAPRVLRINIGNTDENADWVKTDKNKERDRRMTERLEKEQEKRDEAT